MWLIPALPLAGFVLILLFGRRLGEPKAGYLATAMIGGRVRRGRRRVLRPAVEAGRGARPRRDAVRVAAGRVAARRHGVPRRPAEHHDVPVRHRHRLADPPLPDRLHARGPEVLEVLPLPQPVRLLDADARPRREPPRDVPRLGGRRHVLVLPDLVLAHPGVGGDGRQEGVRHQPRRRLRVHAGDVPGLPGRRHGELLGASTTPPRAARSPSRRPPRSPPCCSSAPPARAPSCRCTSGCPTRWRARRRSRRSSTPRRWSPPACSSWCA